MWVYFVGGAALGVAAATWRPVETRVVLTVLRETGVSDYIIRQASGHLGTIGQVLPLLAAAE